MDGRVLAGRLSAQQGQALVMGMLLAGVAIVVFVRYFAAGQVVAAKARQLHALDAAAYSGALTQARALNMLAYINRAQVGHQVAMAHLVTLGSWASLGGHEARQVSAGNPPSYLIAMMFGPQHGAAYQAARKAAGFELMANASGELGQAYAAHDNTVREVLAAVQGDVVDGLPHVRWAAMQAVLRANYPDASTDDFDLVIDHDNWPGYVQAYSGQQLRPFVQGVAQLYGFLSPRDYTASNPWMVDTSCPHLRHELRRRGNTELDAAGRWHSIDTQSYHALRSNKWIGCYYREYTMGWGWIPSATSQAMSDPYVDNPPADFSAQDFWRWVKESTNWDILSGSDNPLANSKAAASRQRWQGGGLPTYFDIASAGKALSFGVTLKHSGPQGLIMSTRSAAETFFDRPLSRLDGRVEHANLFHPYWQARLAADDSNGPNARGRQ